MLFRLRSRQGLAHKKDDNVEKNGTRGDTVYTVQTTVKWGRMYTTEQPRGYGPPYPPPEQPLISL